MLRIKSLHDTVLEQSTQLKKQLKTATKIQILFWPEIPELEAGGHIWAVSIPASYVGGDLYDIIKFSDGSLLAYVADVSDKAHVEHAVGFIDNENFDVGEHQFAALNVIQQAARRCNHDVCATVDLAVLLFKGNAAHQKCDVQLVVFA